MSDWGVRAYGDPCRECGFGWTIGREDAIAFVRGAPDAYAEALRGATGAERHRDLAWPAVGYVCHVADNLRIWAERLAGAASGGSSAVAPYDQDLLAEARNYESVALDAALWSLGRAARDWLSAVETAAVAQVILRHPDRGELQLTDVVRSNSHDAVHHLWDVRRCLEAVED